MPPGPPGRLFVALMPSRTLTAALTEVVGRVRPLATGLNWVAAELWHVTLAFLGEVEDGTRPALDENLAGVARGHQRLRPWLASGSHFDHRVLTCAVGGEPVTALTRAVRTAARCGGVTRIDDRPPAPHLTLAYCRRGQSTDLRPLVAALDASLSRAREDGTGLSWDADRFSLIRSRSAGRGTEPTYREQASWRLGSD